MRTISPGKAEQMFQQLPTVDLAQGVERYFEFVRKAMDVNRELATSWADAVNSLAGVVREQTEKAGQRLTEQTDKVSELTREQAGKFERSAKDQVDLARRSTNGPTDERDEHFIDAR